MASVRLTANGKFELTIRHKQTLGPGKRIFFTFDDKQSAVEYGESVDKLLNAGVVPAGLLPEEKLKPTARLATVLREWINTGKPAVTDRDVLELLIREIGDTPIASITYAWSEAWVQDLKMKANLAPSTIRKRIGALSRCLDWHLRRMPEAMVGNPLRMLPRGSATYNGIDIEQALLLKKVPKVDIERERRLNPGEERAIKNALAGVKRDDRERALAADPAFSLLFHLIVNTGLRLRESYRIKRSQVDLDARKIVFQSSKQWHGRVKFREVPLSPALHAVMTDYFKTVKLMPGDFIFPWWNGSDAHLLSVTAKLSARFRTLFGYAGCLDLREHDLRHEATCRWYEMKTPDGRDTFREAEIHKIMGWAPGSKMATRYASFRAEDLAAKMW